MGELGRDHTSFIIAPRRSTNRDADLIVVIEAGRIIEQGSQAELMARYLTDADICDGIYERDETARRMRNSFLQGDIRSLHLGEQVEAEILRQAVDLLSGVANCAFDEPGRATIGAGAVVVRLHGPLSLPRQKSWAGAGRRPPKTAL